MKKTITASVLALSLALSGISAAPVQAASNQDINRLLAGAVTLFVLGAAIQNSSKPKKQAAPVTRSKPGNPVTRADPYRYAPPKGYRSPKYDKAHKRHPNTLPAECVFPVRTRHGGEREVFGKHCLERKAVIRRPLPRFCEETIKIRHGKRAEVYDKECLLNRGFRVEARRHDR